MKSRNSSDIRLFFFALSFFTFTTARASEYICKNYHLNIPKELGTTTENSDLCMELKRGSHYSKNCGDGNCVANQKRKDCGEKPPPLTAAEAAVEDFEEGSPGFKICHRCGGVPELVEISEASLPKKYRSNRCLFTADKSYLSLDLFIGHRAEDANPSFMPKQNE